MRTACFIFACSLGAQLAYAQPMPVTVTQETAFTFYRPFKRLTEHPHRVGFRTAVLCTSPSAELIEREKQAAGPHYEASVHIYVNELAGSAIARMRFQEGAVIVKEKLANDGSSSGVGGMIKRGAGFDPKNGDWEYFYSDKTAGFSMGRLKNCIECHSAAKPTDYVFGLWKPTR